MRTLLIVSGGDAPGINMALAHYTGLAEANGDSVVGALDGFAGLLKGKVVTLNAADLIPWSGQPGSYLPSSREPVLKQAEARARVLEILAAQHIDNVVLFGGNGTLRYVLPLLSDWDIACVGIPTTIDNDVPGTERTLGFDSACNFAYQTIDGIIATAHALAGRIFMVETLGGDTGFLALAVAFGSRADVVLVPEYEYQDDWLNQRLAQAVERRGYALVILSEGVKTARTLAEQIFKQTTYRVRDVRLGHAQRGSKPSHLDRTLAIHMAAVAYQALCSGTRIGVTVVRDGQVILQPKGLDSFPPPVPDYALYQMINELETA